MPNPNNIGQNQVPFIADWNHSEAFGDLKTSPKVDDTNRMLEQWRSKLPSSESGGVEAAVGVYDVREAGILPILADLNRTVCRITVPPGNYKDYSGATSNLPWSGTGFLVAPNLLLTNNHVLNSREVAKAATVEFEYQLSSTDIMDGPPDRSTPAIQFHLDPGRLFVTSPMDGFDFTFVWIDSVAAEQFGTIPMRRGSFSAKQGEPTYIIHHPEGVPKKVSLDDTEVLSINSAAILYAADTMGGSSGSPVISDRGRLLALHHAWWSVEAAKNKYPNLSGRLSDGGITNVVNEGIKLSAIAIELERRVAAGESDAAYAATVLSHIEGSDTLTGLFGSLGRSASSSESEPNEHNAYEHVVSVYQSSEQDIDIGAWNIEWFNREYTDSEKLKRVAQVITDLNLDIWSLSEVSYDAVNALLRVLKNDYSQVYESAFSEPNSGSGKQATAVIWRPNVVEGERIEWPEDIEKLFNLNSRHDLPFEAVHGKIFNRYPGLFRFSLKSERKKFDFYLVALHLKAKSEGSLRRRLASKVLSYAVEQMIEEHGADKDWILLGDFNATLASKDFEPLTKGGFAALSAEDEKNGAFTYLKAPYKSLIDHIFLSANMKKYADKDDFFIIAHDKIVDQYVKNISDHRPTAMRLSLTEATENAVGDTGHQSRELDEAFAQMLQTAGVPQNATCGLLSNNTLLQNHSYTGDGSADLLDSEVTSSRFESDGRWHTANLTKLQFLQSNERKLKRLIDRVNTSLTQQYDGGAKKLSFIDVAVLFMVEAGIYPNGIVNPEYIHSNGEYGLLPLPNNIRYWVGSTAPAFDEPMSVNANIDYYIQYLGALKNKPVKQSGGLMMYRDLFQASGISGSSEIEAKLLAGIVHGYFWSGNYGGHRAPIPHILDGYSKNQPLDVIMKNTNYVHAGKTLLINRQKNIEFAVVNLAQ